MQEDRRDSALMLIEEIRGHARLPDHVLDLLNDIQKKVSISHYFLEEDQEDVWNVPPSSLYAGLWTQLINLSIRLVESVEQSTGALPGCLPLIHEDCELVSKAIQLKEAISANYFLLEMSEKRKR